MLLHGTESCLAASIWDEEAQKGLSWLRSCPCQGHRESHAFCKQKLSWLDAQDREGLTEQRHLAQGGLHLELQLTNPEFKIVERMLVDLLYAFGQGKREVSQGTQVPPFIVTLLEKIWEKDSFRVTDVCYLQQRFCNLTPTAHSFWRKQPCKWAPRLSSHQYPRGTRS